MTPLNVLVKISRSEQQYAALKMLVNLTLSFTYVI